MFFLADKCETIRPVIAVLKAIINIIKWGVPILLIIFGTIDLAKAVVAGKEDEMKKAQNTFIRRLVYAIAVFLVVTLVSFVIGVVAKNASDKEDSSAIKCWNETTVKY